MMDQVSRINVYKDFYDKLIKSQELKDLFFKTQVLNRAVDNPELELTNRGIHSVHVSETAGNIASNCGLGEEDIIKAKIIGLCHDLGHTPIGHAGEDAINDFVKEKTDKKSTFSHAKYSGVVLQFIIDKNRDKLSRKKEAALRKGYNAAVEFYENKITIIDSVKNELINGVINHTSYYEHVMESKSETNAQKCGRLADSLSFMPSDLSDLMRSYSETEPDKKIVERNDIDELKERLAKTEGYDEKTIDEVVEQLEKDGQHGIPKIQKEIALEISNLSSDGKINGISDTYKYTKEIDYLYRNDKNVAFKILEFDKYAKNHIDGYKGLDEETHALFSYQSMKELPNSFRKEDYEERLKEAGKRYREVASDPSIVGDRDKEAVEYNNKLDNYYKNNIEERLNTERKYLREKAPYLAATYELQDDLQYNNILFQGKTNVYGNREEVYKPAIKNLLEGYSKFYDTKKPDVIGDKPFTSDEGVNYAVSKVHLMTNVELNAIIDKYPEVKIEGYAKEKSLPMEEIDKLAYEVRKERIASQDGIINQQILNIGKQQMRSTAVPEQLAQDQITSKEKLFCCLKNKDDLIALSQVVKDVKVKEYCIGQINELDKYIGKYKEDLDKSVRNIGEVKSPLYDDKIEYLSNKIQFMTTEKGGNLRSSIQNGDMERKIEELYSGTMKKIEAGVNNTLDVASPYSDLHKVNETKKFCDLSKKIVRLEQGLAGASQMEAYKKLIPLKKEQANLMKNAGEINKMRVKTANIER
jgi:dGTP triphosphohydrolase